jgi:hypothetical protein
MTNTFRHLFILSFSRTFMQAFLVHFKSLFPVETQKIISEIPAKFLATDEFKEYKALMDTDTLGKVHSVLR